MNSNRSSCPVCEDRRRQDREPDGPPGLLLPVLRHGEIRLRLLGRAQCVLFLLSQVFLKIVLESSSPVIGLVAVVSVSLPVPVT